MRPKAKHGTRSKYVGGCRCGKCRKANSEYQVAWDLRAGRKKYGAKKWEQIRPRAEHGSAAKYCAGCRCDDCRAACRVAQAAWRKSVSGNPPTHGTYNAYHNYSCRCDPCRAAGSESNRRQRERRKAVSA